MSKEEKKEEPKVEEPKPAVEEPKEKITAEDQAVLDKLAKQQAENQVKAEACSAEIEEVLKKHNCSINVLTNPSISVRTK